MRFLHFATPRGGFTFDISGDLDLADTLSDKVKRIEKVQRRTVGTLRRRLRTEARRDIQREYNLKAADINERLSVSTRYDGIALVGRASGINLIHFGARWKRSWPGVTYRVKKSGGRKTLAHAFIRKTRKGAGPFVWMRSEGHSRTFVRNLVRSDGVVVGTRTRTRNSAYSDEHGYPIFQQYGPSIAQMLKHGDRPQRLVAFAQQTILHEIERQLGAKP